jgi:hypothetical protein
MFYARINKIKIFNNREGFLGLFNSAEMRIYSYANPSPALPQGEGVALALTLGNLADLPDETSRKEKLMEAVLTEAEHFAQSQYLAINSVKDNQTLLFGDTGLLIYQSERIPDELQLQLWVIESDEDVRNFAIDAGEVLDSDAFKGLCAAVMTALAVINPVLTGAISVGGVVANLLRRKLKANKDDLVGYWQCNLNREEHYPHGTRDKEDVPDTTGNIRVDYMVFGFEESKL